MHCVSYYYTLHGIFCQVTFDKQVMTRSVALAGDVFDPSGTLTGGARPKTSSILTKLGELFDCEQLLQEKERELKTVTAQIQDVQKVAAKWVWEWEISWIHKVTLGTLLHPESQLEKLFGRPMR